MSDGSSGKDFSIRNLTASIHTRGCWIDGRFEDYSLFPVIGDDETTKRMLSSETVGKRVLNAFVRRANLSTLVNSLTGFSLLSKSQEGNLIEEAYKIIDENKKLKETINDRIKEAYSDTRKAGLAFSSVKEDLPIIFNDDRPRGTLFEKINYVDRKFVSVHGVLCRVNCAQQVDGATIARSLSNSGIAWVIADYPYFVMGRPEFHDGVVLLNMNPKVTERLELENALPFWSEVGWFPYVRVSGVCQYPYSPRYQYPAITPSWIEYRTPKNPQDMRDRLQDVYKNSTAPRRFANVGYAVLKENPLDVLTYIDVVKIVAKGKNLDVSSLEWIKDTFQDAKARAETVKELVFRPKSVA